MRSLWRYARLLGFVGLGAGALIAGEMDDSPGLQGIGLLLIIVSLFLHWRSRKSPTS